MKQSANVAPYAQADARCMDLVVAVNHLHSVSSGLKDTIKSCFIDRARAFASVFHQTTTKQTASNATERQLVNVAMVDVVFLAYCKTCYLSLSEQQQQQLPWDLKAAMAKLPYCRPPLCEPRPLIEDDTYHAELYKALFLSDPIEYIHNLRESAIAWRWYHRIVNPTKRTFQPSPVSKQDQHYLLFRANLLRGLFSKPLLNTFDGRAMEWIKGSRVKLGSREAYKRDHPFEGQSTPVSVLLARSVDEKELQRIESIAYTDFRNRPVFDALAEEFQDIWLMSFYALRFDQRTPSDIQFQRRFLLMWHEWEEMTADTLLSGNTLFHKPRLPVICALGDTKFGVLQNQKDWFVCDGLVHALFVWLQIVKSEHKGLTEDGCGVWDAEYDMNDVLNDETETAKRNAEKEQILAEEAARKKKAKTG